MATNGNDSSGEGSANQQHGVHTATTGRTGPRTRAGKDRSKRNSVKHGFFSQAIVLLPHESQSELDDLVKRLRRSRKPKDPMEDLIVDWTAFIFWRYRRFVRELGDQRPLDIDMAISGLADLSIRIETHLGRELDRALKQLKQVQDMRERQSGITQLEAPVKGEVRLAQAPPKA